MTRFYLVLILIILFTSCEKTDPAPSENLVVNSLGLTIQNRTWTPSVIDGDSCQQTFNCELFFAGNGATQTPFYRVKASQFEDYHLNLKKSDFRLQVRGVDKETTYSVSDAVEDFSSYAMYIDYESNEKKIYTSEGSNSTLEILKMLPIEDSQLIGFEGRFIGTLYNTENVNDSIQIKSKSLKFLQINRHDYQQCL